MEICSLEYAQEIIAGYVACVHGWGKRNTWTHECKHARMLMLAVYLLLWNRSKEEEIWCMGF